MRLPKIGKALIVSSLPFICWSLPGYGSTDETTLERYSDAGLINFVRTVVEANPRAQAARAGLEASRALESAAGRPLYNPQLDADYENSVDQRWEVGIGQTLDWSGKRKARSRVAASDRFAVEAEYLATKRELAVDLLSGLTLYQIGVQRDSLADERKRVMHDFSQLARRRFDAGDLSQVEADLATLASLDAQIQRASAAAGLAEAKQTVRNLTLYSEPDQWPSVNSNLPALPTVDDPQVWVSELPEVQAAQRRVEAADELIGLREKEKRPDPTLSVRGGMEADSTLIGLNLSVPLFIRNSFDYEVSAATAERDKAQQLANDMQRRAYARFLSASERYELSRNAWQGWEEVGKLSLQRQGDLLQRMWEAGELSTTEFLVQLRQTLDTRESALDLKLTMWRAWFEWLAASGQVDNWLSQGEAQ